MMTKIIYTNAGTEMKWALDGVRLILEMRDLNKWLNYWFSDVSFAEMEKSPAFFEIMASIRLHAEKEFDKSNEIVDLLIVLLALQTQLDFKEFNSSTTLIEVAPEYYTKNISSRRLNVTFRTIKSLLSPWKKNIFFPMYPKLSKKWTDWEIKGTQILKSPLKLSIANKSLFDISLTAIQTQMYYFYHTEEIEKSFNRITNIHKYKA